MEVMMADRKVFQDSVTALPEQMGLTPHGLMVQAMEAEHSEEPMTLLFSLAIPKEAQDELESRVAKGEVVSFDEMKKSYSPKAADVDGLVSWLKGQGYEIVQTGPDGTGVYARAKASQIEQSLQVKLVRVTKEGLTYTAAQNAPSLPADVGNSVHAIIGLQPFRQAHKHFKRRIPQAGNRVSPTASTPGPGVNILNSPPYLVPEVLKAYNADGLAVTGKGQTIAILIDTFPADADVKAFWKRNNIAGTSGRIQKVNVKGGPLPPPEGEE